MKKNWHIFIAVMFHYFNIICIIYTCALLIDFIFNFLDLMVQRCVIIQKDEKGYGLTVSGDNPVFVQSVKEGEIFCN